MLLRSDDDESTTDAPDRTPTNDIQVIARTAQVLRLLTMADSVDVVATATALEIGRSSAHRYLSSMERHGLLARRDRNTYEVGTLMTQLGAAALARSGVIRAARPLMEALRDEVRQTITLALWNGASAVVAHVTEDTSRTAHVSVQVGRALRSDAAQTVIFRAFVDGARLPSTPGDERSAEEDVREAGVAVRDAPEDGVRAVAVPILDPSGAVIATLAAVGIAQLVPGDADSPLARALIRTSARVTQALGSALRTATSD